MRAIADFDCTENIVKLRPTTPASNIGGRALVPAEGEFNFSALARQHGVHRRTIKRWLDDGWRPDQAVVKVEPQILPPAPPAQEDAHLHAHPARTPAHHGGSYVAAGVLALAAVALGGIQLAIDAQYAGSFGRTPIETALQGMQGVAIGVVAMILPCVASVLRRTGQIGLSRGAWAIWSGFLVLTILAGMGFSAGGLSDAIAGRAGAIEQAVLAKDQRAQSIATAQRAADAMTEARKAECAARGPRCRDREADERTALAALNTAIATPLPLAPAIASADPGGDAAAANLTWLSGGIVHASAGDIGRVWIAGRAIMPAFAGLLLSMAIMLWPRRRCSDAS
jgi:hypothetical protein